MAGRASSRNAVLETAISDATPLDGAPAAGRSAILQEQATSLGVIAVLALLTLTPAARAMEFLFPAATGAFAGVLMLRGRSAHYVTFCLWMFLLSPFVRRLADYRTDFTEGNLILAAPYLATAMALLVLPRYLTARGQAGQIAVAAVMASATYGLVVGMVQSRYGPAVYDWLRWSAPAALAAYIILHSAKSREIVAGIQATAAIALPLLSVYGLYQFVAPPGWDALWMIGSKMDSIGVPEPYLIRVFGTLNSPGSFAFYLVALIAVTLPMRTPLTLPGLVLGAAALATTLVRTGWFALAIVLLVLLIIGTWRARATVGAAVLGAALLLPFAMIHPAVERTVSSRIESLTLLQQDKSALDRGRAYSEFGAELEQQPLGQGLGISGAYQSFGGGGPARIIDGGPIEIFLALGVFGGALYFVGIVGGAVLALTRRPNLDKGVTAAAKAIVVAFFFCLFSSTTTVGEIGLLFWLALGLLFVKPATQANVTLRTQTTPSAGYTLAG